MKTITEISKYKFLEMMAFCDAYKKVNGKMPDKKRLYKEFGEIKTKLFANMMFQFDEGGLNLNVFLRATLRDDGNIEYKYYRK